MGKDEHDKEGRLITAEYPTLYVVNAYIPNSGEGLKRLDYRLQQWDVHFAEYLQQLATKKPVVLTGDLNCAHQEIDIHAPKKNLRSPGFTQVYIHAADITFDGRPAGRCNHSYAAQCLLVALPPAVCASPAFSNIALPCLQVMQYMAVSSNSS